jgi:hypothetical protein
LATHRSRVCQFVIDVSDLDQGVAFWTAALDGIEEQTSETSRQIYRRIRLPDSEIRILLQKTGDRKISKERMHIDLETDNVEAEVERLEALGAVRWDHQQERGFDFWVLHDPWGSVRTSALTSYRASTSRATCAASSADPALGASKMNSILLKLTRT